MVFDRSCFSIVINIIYKIVLLQYPSSTQSQMFKVIQTRQKSAVSTSFKNRLKKKQSRKVHFFFANSLSIDFNFKTAMLECMPHHPFTSKPLHEYHSLFFNFRLDFLIGLKIKFNVRHKYVQKQLGLPVKRLKNVLCRFPIDVSFEITAYKVVLKSSTL